jgi:hypothetical protein
MSPPDHRNPAESDAAAPEVDRLGALIRPPWIRLLAVCDEDADGGAAPSARLERAA